MAFQDPIKNIIKYLTTNDNTSSLRTVVEIGEDSGLYRIYHNAIRFWDMKDDECKALTLTKIRDGEGKNALDQTVEMAFECICWSNKNKESELMDLWVALDEIFHNQHNTIYESLTVIHSFRSQEPVFDNRFALNLSPATTRLSSRTKLRLPSVSSTYTFLAMEN